MAIAGHLSRGMVEHYSHIRMAAKRAALDAIASAPEMPFFRWVCTKQPKAKRRVLLTH